MRRLSTSLIFLLSFCAIACAQMNPSHVDALSGASAGDPVPNTPEWQLTLDVIKSKARSLMERNTALLNERDTLTAAIQKARIDQRDWKFKNEALRLVLKQRRGKSEQQIEIEELNNQIRAKERNIKSLQKTLQDIQRDKAEEERKIQLRKLKASEVELHVKLEASQEKAINTIDQRSAIENDEEYNQLRQKLQDERNQENDLKAQLQALKKASLAPSIPSVDEESQIKTLESTAESLRQQKEDLQNRLNVDNNGTNTQRYLQLMTKKKELEGKIKEFEGQLNQLKEPATFGLLDSKQKKQIVRQMAQIDTRNTRLRQKISDLKEDVSLLREQVSRLERRTQGIKSTEVYKK